MSTPSAQPPKTTETEPMTRARSRSFMIVALRSAKGMCSESTSPLASGTAAHTSGGPPCRCSCTYVPRRLSRIRWSSWAGSDGSLIFVPKRGSLGFDVSYIRCAKSRRSICTSRALSSIEIRAALCTTMLRVTAISAPTAAMATAIFQRTPVRRGSSFTGTCPSS